MQPTKVYYSIAEVRQLTELPSATLRYWEQQFAQLSPYKDEHGNRYYTEKDIALIKQIKYIRDELHITRIEAIKNELKQGTKQTDVRQRAAEILQHVREELADIRTKILLFMVAFYHKISTILHHTCKLLCLLVFWCGASCGPTSCHWHESNNHHPAGFATISRPL